MPCFEDVAPGGGPVGEVWFEAPAGGGQNDPDLLIKYLFTGERLSVQVHPGDEDAQARGFVRGKNEAWQILWAEDDAKIAIGPMNAMSQDELREASLDGSIVDRLDWKPAVANEFWYSPAGTVHAIGGGIILVEVQQNLDLTYRLYDYGSDRELHLDDGVAVSDPIPYKQAFVPFELSAGRKILAAGGAFVVERWTEAFSGQLAATPDRNVWLVPLVGRGRLGDLPIEAGGVWVADGPVSIVIESCTDMLVCYPGGQINESLAEPGSQ